MASDDVAILSVLDEVSSKYRIESKAVMLTGFSAGGFPMYNTGLRHPERFNMLVAMSCNSDDGLFDKITLTPELRKEPVVIFWGMDDPALQEHCWRAVQYFSNHGFTDFQHKTFRGGHLRRPDIAYRYWQSRLPHPPPTP